MKKIAIFLSTIYILFAIISQAISQITFEKTYGGSGVEWGNQIVNTDNGDFIIAGYTTSFPEGNFQWNQDAWILRVNSSGDTIWTRRYGTSGNDMALSIIKSNSSFIITGYKYTSLIKKRDAWIIKIDSNGDTIWTKSYGGNKKDAGESIAPTDDGGYIVVGETQSFGPGDYDIWILRLNADGDTVWTRTYDNGNRKDDLGKSIVPLRNNKFLISANTNFILSPIRPISDVWFLLIDINGDTLITNRYDSSLTDYIYSFSATSDGGAIAAGTTDLIDLNPAEDLWIVKLDSLCNISWSKIYGNYGKFDGGRSAIQTMDGGYIVTGYTQSSGPEFDNLWLLKLDSHGDTLWTKVFGYNENDGGLSILQTDDKGYIVTGYTGFVSWPLNAIPGNSDVYLIKTNPKGQIATGINDKIDRHIISENKLSAYPNPFNPSTMIEFDLHKDQHVKMIIYNLEGQIIELLKNETMNTGSHTIEWTPPTGSSGTYFCELNTLYSRHIIKLIFIK
jgi:hypothetical protein